MLLFSLTYYADVPVLSLMAVCRILTHTRTDSSLAQRYVLTINNLICTQTLTYIHTVQVGGFRGVLGG